MNKSKLIAGVCLITGIIVIIVGFLFIGKKNTYEVVFDTDGGSYVATQTVDEGGRVSKPSNPTKEGYSFVMWEYQNKEYDFTSSVEMDITLKAIWEMDSIKPEQKYKITFNVDGKIKVVEVSEVDEIKLSDLGFEEKKGYVLKWYVNGKEYDFKTPLTSDISIEGKYEKTTSYTVTFNSNGGNKVDNQVINAGGKVLEPKDVKKEGYILDGWYLNNTKYDFNTEVTKNITLVAKWTEDPNVKRYEVKFNSDGGSTVQAQRVIENKKATKPKDPTKTGFVFEGWYLNNTKYDFNLKVTSNITLKAKWREVEKYTVTFDSAGGSNVASQLINEGEKATKPKDPTKTGYIFDGWYLNNTKYDFNSKVTSNITLKAKWREPASYTVTFDSAGGSIVASQVIKEGGKVTEPKNPTKSGYEFKGWQLNGKKYNFDSVVTGNITLTATWTAVAVKKYTFKVTLVDDQSPDRIITVYEDGVKINFKSIKVNGNEICTGSNPTVNKYQIQGKNSITVILNNGASVTATLS